MPDRIRRRAAAIFLLPAMLAGCGPADGDDAAASPGERIYLRHCYSCHATGAAGAPRVGDRSAWAERTAQGWSVLMDHTVDGLRRMPARGLCRQCSDDELALTVGWMLERSGGLPADVPDGLAARLGSGARAQDPAEIAD